MNLYPLCFQIISMVAIPFVNKTDAWSESLVLFVFQKVRWNRERFSSFAIVHLGAHAGRIGSPTSAGGAHGERYLATHYSPLGVSKSKP